MEYALTAAWTVTSEWPLVVSSESSQLAISLPRDVAQVVSGLLRGWEASTRPELEPLREALVTRGVLSPSVISLEPAQSRQIEYWRAFTDEPVEAVERLRRATVAIVGCGGVGAVVLQHLVGAGVRNFRLLDSDSVERSNFNRQFIFSIESLGASKVDESARYVAQRSPGGDVRTMAARWDATSGEQRDFLTRNVDLVIAAIDQPSIESSLSVMDIAWAALIPSIVATVGLEKSLVSQIFDRTRSSREPRASLLRREGSPSGAIVASHGPTNTLAATVAADQAVHSLAGLHHRVNYERPLILMRSPDGSYTSIRVEHVRL